MIEILSIPLLLTYFLSSNLVYCALFDESGALVMIVLSAESKKFEY